MTWDANNETLDLEGQSEAYKARFEFYPEGFMPIEIYRTRNNIRFCKKHGIRLSCPMLGRPSADEEKRMAARKQARQDDLNRIPKEIKFGQGKRRFSLSMIMCKLLVTSVTAIAFVFLVMNL